MTTSPNRPNLIQCKFALFAALFCAVAIWPAPANAGEEKSVAVAPAPVPQPFNWSGFYIGANLGAIRSEYDFSDSAHNDNIFADLDVADQFYDTLQPMSVGVSGVATFFGHPHGENSASVIGGGQIGYNRQFGQFVIGIEGEFDRTSMHDSVTFHDSATTDIFGDGMSTLSAETNFSGTRKAETNWTGSLLGRLGYAPNSGPFLIYGIGGITWADVTATATDVARTDFFASDGRQLVVDAPQQGTEFIGSVTNTNISRDDGVRMGWTFGGGLEWAISDTVSLGLEYRHTTYDNETFHFSANDGPIFPGSTRVGLDTNQVTLRFNVLLSHLFCHQDLATTTAGFSKEAISSKDKNVAVMPEEPFDWTGFYFGGNVGGVWNDFDFGGYRTDVDIDEQFFGSGVPYSDFNRFNTPAIDGGSDDSMLGGGQVGFNKQWGHFVVGVEGDFSGMSSGSSTRWSGTEVGFVDSVTAVTELTTIRKADVNWNASVRARLGWAKGRLLLYATGGVAWADVSTWALDTASTDFFSHRFFSETDKIQSRDEQVVTGWTGGGGGEWAMTNIVSIGLEYRHNGFGDQTYHYADRHGPIFQGSTRVDLDSDQVTLRINILLGRIHGP